LIVGSSVPPEPPTGELRVVGDVATAFAGLVESEFAGAILAAGDGGSGSYDGTFRMALSGGDTARSCYESLATVTTMDWASVECFLGDERCVPAGDPAANQRLVHEALLDRVQDLPRFHPIDCEDPESYSALLETRPPLDLIHLGLGPDGHTASLFPGSTALAAPAGALVVANEDPSGRNPLPRVTFTYEAIAKCRLVVFTVAGAAKHDALSRVLAGADLPAARVRARRVLWLCDEGALGA
jgi:6-phosphogluconolactonase